jgi:hypothetical protein
VEFVALLGFGRCRRVRLFPPNTSARKKRAREECGSNSGSNWGDERRAPTNGLTGNNLQNGRLRTATNGPRTDFNPRVAGSSPARLILYGPVLRGFLVRLRRDRGARRPGSAWKFTECTRGSWSRSRATVFRFPYLDKDRNEAFDVNKIPRPTVKKWFQERVVSRTLGHGRSQSRQ